MSVYRLFVTKHVDSEAQHMAHTIREDLHIPVKTVTIYERYDVEGISRDQFESASKLIFSEAPVESYYETLPVNAGDHVVAIEYVPGQYDQRADSAEQCLAMLTLESTATVRTARVFVLNGDLNDEDIKRITHHYMNPVDSRVAHLELPTSLDLPVQPAEPVAILEGFTGFDETELSAFIKRLGLAMTLADAKLIQNHFVKEGRNPSMTEIRVLDTYWSDHCRHTTFMTELTDIHIDESPYTAPIQKALENYTNSRNALYTSKVKARTLMDMATIAVKELRSQGGLTNLDASEEINACTIIVPVMIDGKEEEWLLLFKNETHNHPTEIEPFGGAATCLGGCIRDPLSGRSYVYQAMRVTGSGNPFTPLEDTLSGKLPQRQITKGAAHGYSSYGNQIGLATGEVREYYHDGYVAKRLEVGAVVAATPRSAVRREAPVPGDIVVLLGGKTGRDGCGGATGSSKEHTIDSLDTCGAEVQKGNALTERKIQRLFRRPEVTTLVKRCNDFGAGGVSVAIGELTDGLYINLDKVPKKYDGLDGTELAISESQERMACVIEPKDWDAFKKYCDEENIEATVVADVTDSNRLQMVWQGTMIVDLCRDFLNTNGASQQTTAHITAPAEPEAEQTVSFLEQSLFARLKDLNTASQQGLGEMFDASIGSNTVLMPYSGKYQKTPVQGMVAKLPVLGGTTTTASVMTHGFDPYLSEWSPFHGAQYAVLLSIAKLVALGGNRRAAYLSLQEYFEKMQNPMSWGKPVAALLGAYEAQRELGVGAIGGKDSMSGTFMDLHVPPTLISFAVTTEEVDHIISPHLKAANHSIVLLETHMCEDGTPNWDEFRTFADLLRELNLKGQVHSAYVVEQDGIAVALAKMALGNRIGLSIDDHLRQDVLFRAKRGSFLIEVDNTVATDLVANHKAELIATTTGADNMQLGSITIPYDDIQTVYEKTFSDLFPIYGPSKKDKIDIPVYTSGTNLTKSDFTGAPRVVIPIFPGTNCEFDSARAFEEHGGIPVPVLIRNQTAADLEDSIQAMKRAMDEAQIIFFPGGFSAGDEPGGSGKFMATLFRNPYLNESLENLLYKRDGLALGICNGFQALIKLGLLPTGHVAELKEDSPTLTFNTIGRHLSGMVHTKVVSNKSPWLSACEVGSIYTVPISHGEGRFLANDAVLAALAESGQIATQYVDFDGVPSYDSRFNPNGSVGAVEGILSPDGRVFGKMAHAERIGYKTSLNIEGHKVMPIFESGVKYFK